MADNAHIVYGVHAVDAVLARRPRAIVGATVLEGPLSGRLADCVAQLKDAGVVVERANRATLDRLAQGGVHQGIVVRVPPPEPFGLDVLERIVAKRGAAVRLLVLDQVEDPRNLGACLRTADAAGVDAVIVPKARSAKLSSAALKAAAGGAETVPLIIVPNLARCLRWIQDAGLTLVGLDERGAMSYFDADLRAPIALVLGAEGRGLRRLTREACDVLLRIPMLGTVESLNVSVATGIVLYEMLRQSA